MFLIQIYVTCCLLTEKVKYLVDCIYDAACSKPEPRPAYCIPGDSKERNGDKAKIYQKDEFARNNILLYRRLNLILPVLPFLEMVCTFGWAISKKLAKGCLFLCFNY